MKKILLGLGASAVIATALMAATALPAFAKTHRRGRVLAAAIVACNKTARDARKDAWKTWKAATDKIRADRLACLAAAKTGADRKACNKTARDAMKAANDALRDAYKAINKTRLDCIHDAQGK